MAPRLEAVRGDITAELVDAVVNAANAGSAAAVASTAPSTGPPGRPAADACRAIGGCPPGDRPS